MADKYCKVILASPAWFNPVVQSLTALKASPRLSVVKPLVVYVLNQGVNAPDPKKVSGGWAMRCVDISS